jgi:hypothetical protein
MTLAIPKRDQQNGRPELTGHRGKPAQLWRLLMTSRILVSATFVGVLVSPAFAEPQLTLVKGGLEAGNWVWQVDITPDLVAAGGETLMAIEMGFRLTGAPLLNVTNINPSQWTTPIPGRVIFGWETLTDLDPGPGVNNHPVGLQSNTATEEIFVAYGSVDFSTPGPKPFLKIVAQGPGNGGPLSSAIDWLGVYAVGQGRISQLINGGATAGNFDIFAGTATQLVPEPTVSVLLAWGCVFLAPKRASRHKHKRRWWPAL